LEFYQKVFGWQFVRDEQIPIEYYRIQGAGPMGGLLKRPAKVPSSEQGTNAFTCSIQVENFDDTAKKILENNGQMAMPKFAVPGKCGVKRVHWSERA
jgi:predicted enzyme related to lactoylglutathione lyase